VEEGGIAEATAPVRGLGRRRIEAADRPGASGHRFGPDLECSECGLPWDAHQREPRPCRTESPPDAFARRPSGDFDDATAEPPRRATAASEEEA
jgi:hypothetical protein